MLVKKLLYLIILISTGAPVFSGAFAQNKEDDLSALIRMLSSVSESNEEVRKDTVNPENVLDNLINSARSQENVLDFMTKIYADHDFYQSGHWDDAEDFRYITRNVVLPDYDPDDFYRPVWGRVTSTYGFRPSLGRLHKGIDLALHIGDTVRAALPGVVAKVAYDPGGYGHYVVLVHNNGLETRYAHLLLSLSSLGKTLAAGEPLGLGGNSGNSTGPHLHFEVRYRGSAIDPASMFNFHIAKRKDD